MLNTFEIMSFRCPTTLENSLYICLLILLLVKGNGVSCQRNIKISSNSLPVCSDFINHRHSSFPLIENTGNFIIFPATRTNLIRNSTDKKDTFLKFALQTNLKLKCPEEIAEIINIPWKLDKHIFQLQIEKYSDIDISIHAPHQHSYFTSSGYFYDNSSQSYYKPDGDYCIKSTSRKDIVLKVCVVDNNCKNSATQKTWCLPKCCPVDEYLIYRTRKCAKLPHIGNTTPWLPEIFQGPENPYQELKDASKNLIFRTNQLNKNCMYHKNHRGVQVPLLRWLSTFSSSHIRNPINDIIINDYLKLTATPDNKSGKIRPIILSKRRWMTKKNMLDFCVDGFVVGNPNNTEYFVKRDDFVMYYCDDEEYHYIFYKAASWAFLTISVISSLFLFTTILIYLALWEKQNLHGITILNFSTATFCSHLFAGFANVMYLFPNKKSSIGSFERVWYCYIIAVLSHFFFLSSNLWLTVMNIDLWLTFSSFRHVKHNEKEWKQFGWYGLFAWIFPFLLVTAFVVVDEVYRNPETEVIVPDYAIKSCFVSEDFRTEYVFIPWAIILGFNIILIGLTMKVFINARKQRTYRLSGVSSNAHKYSGKLFAKLFMIMGGASMVNLLTWNYNGKRNKHWGFYVLDGIHELVPVALFVLFCLNTRVLGQLREKYPAFTDLIGRCLRMKCFRNDENVRLISKEAETVSEVE